MLQRDSVTFGIRESGFGNTGRWDRRHLEQPDMVTQPTSPAGTTLLRTAAWDVPRSKRLLLPMLPLPAKSSSSSSCSSCCCCVAGLAVTDTFMTKGVCECALALPLRTSLPAPLVAPPPFFTARADNFTAPAAAAAAVAPTPS